MSDQMNDYRRLMAERFQRSRDSNSPSSANSAASDPVAESSSDQTLLQNEHNDSTHILSSASNPPFHSNSSPAASSTSFPNSTFPQNSTSNTALYPTYSYPTNSNPTISQPTNSNPITSQSTSPNPITSHSTNSSFNSKFSISTRNSQLPQSHQQQGQQKLHTSAPQNSQTSAKKSGSKPTMSDEEYARQLQREFERELLYEDEYSDEWDDEDDHDEETDHHYSALGNHPIFSSYGRQNSMLAHPMLRTVMNNPHAFPSSSGFGQGFQQFLRNAQFQTDDYETLLQLDEINGQVSKGATKMEISAIGNIRKFSAREKETAAEEERRCGICLEDYDPGDSIRTLQCAHAFHQKCIDQWLEINRICAVCRKDQFSKKN